MLKGFLRRVGNLLGQRKIDESLFEELEEALILADVSLGTTDALLLELRKAAGDQRITEASDLRECLVRAIAARLGGAGDVAPFTGPEVKTWLILGVNGTGKTTTVGKLAYWARQQGARPLLAAADTFRAAAIEQLQAWGDRAQVPVVAHQPGADPAAVTFDAIRAAKARNCNLVLVDTAGRLHTKHNLMEELGKIARAVEREGSAAPEESLLVLDATTGQNGLAQAAAFSASVPLTGTILTKLDGTARGGIVLSIHERMGLPIKFVGTGESIEALDRFDPAQYVAGLFE